jgi:hypothetical protein
VRRIGWRRTQRSLDHSGNLIVVDGARATGAGFVKQAITAILQESAAPLANGVFVQAEFSRHILARQTVRASQNDAAPLRQRSGNPVTTNLPLQI